MFSQSQRTDCYLECNYLRSEARHGSRVPAIPFSLFINRSFETLFVSKKDVGQAIPSCHNFGRVQPTVTFPIADHVNVLHDYKKTGPSKILKLLTCRCHHLIDMLIEFSQSLILLTLLKCLNVPYTSMFTNFCMNYYAHWPCCERNCKKSFRLLKSSKHPQLHCQQVLLVLANLPMCLLKCSYVR